MEYTITVADIQNYLQTLEPGEEAGRIRDFRSCLVARALKHKYGEPFGVGATCFWPLRFGSPTTDLPKDIAETIPVFDASRGSFDTFSRTRAEVEAAISALK